MSRLKWNNPGKGVAPSPTLEKGAFGAPLNISRFFLAGEVQESSVLYFSHSTVDIFEDILLNI